MTTTTTERALPVATALGAIIHQAMWQKRITQGAMGDAIGVKQSTMGKKLRGQVPITVDELTTIAGLLGEDPGYLMLCACRDSNPKPSVLESAACPGCGTEGGCTCWLGRISRQGHLDTDWALAA
jgi:hypothetical protein